MIRKLAFALLASGLAAASAHAEVKRAPSSGPIAISPAVTVTPGSTLVFLSGALPTIADKNAPGDTATQSRSVLSKLEAALKAQGLGFGDVIKATVFLVGDPAKGGEIDFAGLNAAWSEAFGTTAQPNKPARSTVKVAGLVAPGALVEIEFVAAR
ncbi:Rid family hydrolase [Caulobacter segnis]